jgi:hypothetical protein
MHKKHLKMLLILITLVFSFLTSPSQAHEGHWFASIYQGEYSHNPLNQIIWGKTEFEDSYIAVASVGKEVGRLKDYLALEMEGQLATHNGMQDNEELNGVFTLRWLPFPWDKYLDTSFAFGNGISYATADPEVEILDNSEHKTNQWLYYILVEWAFQVPKLSHWDLFVRLHHRSSVFGAIAGPHAGSNFVGLGLRYRWN